MNEIELKAAQSLGLSEDTKVQVRRKWKDHMTGTVLLKDLGGFHRSQISGGILVKAPRPFIHAYMDCTDIIDGEIAHSCEHGEPPHNIKVVLTRKDNERKFWRQLSMMLKIKASSL